MSHHEGTPGASDDDSGVARPAQSGPGFDERTGVLGSLNPDSAPMEPVDHRTMSGIGEGAAVLLVLRGQAEGTRVYLDPDVELITVGRSPDATVFLDDVTVSRHHAELSSTLDGWRLRDVGSLNGSYVNRSRVDNTLLVGGDEVQIGKYRFAFLSGRSDGAEA